MPRSLLLTIAFGLAVIGLAPFSAAQDGDGWVQLFNGKDLTGWKTFPGEPGEWSVVDGCIVGKGAKTSHLFTEKGDYADFHYKVVAKISDKGNSGQYFRTKFAKGFPPGYEAQINSTYPDPQKTGSLYNFVKVKDQLVEPDTWFTQEIIAEGNHIQILVNGKKTADHVDEKKTYMSGHFAFQQHPPTKGGPNGVVTIKSAAVKILSAK
jgi:hypothetical protein